MKLAIFIASCCITVLLGTAANGYAQDTLYSRAFGNPADPAVIFLHGGPGYNCYSFEISTAPVLAKLKYYVIVYDQRGCGRSKIRKPAFTLDESIADLESIYRRYGLTKARLIGHSWGGTIAIKFALRHPEMATAVALVSSPLSYQMTLRTALAKARAKIAMDSAADLTMVGQIEKMDTASLPYATSVLTLAMQSGLYKPAHSTDSAAQLYAALRHSPDSLLLRDNSLAAIVGLYKHEHFTTLDLSDDLISLKGKTKVFAFFGSEDGLFDPEQIAKVRAIIGDNHVRVLAGASHNLFIDQQREFLDLLP